MIKKMIYYSFFLTLVACGSGGGGNTKSNSDNSGGTTSSGLPNDLNGSLVFDWTDWSERQGSYKVSIQNGKIIKSKNVIAKGDGDTPFLHIDGDIVYIQSCGSVANRVVILKSNGRVSDPITPCSDNVLAVPSSGAYTYDKFLTDFISAKLSPDKTKLATLGEYYTGGVGGYSGSGDFYMTIIYDVASMKELKRYRHYTTPAWFPNGDLLLQATGYGDLKSDFGLYKTDKDFLNEPYRIDKKEIKREVLNPSINPVNQQIAFSMGSQIWLMDSTGENLHEAVSEGAALRYPAWSPKGEYLAYFSYFTDREVHHKITFYQLNSQKKYLLNTDSILPAGSLGTHSVIMPIGPLSWSK